MLNSHIRQDTHVLSERDLLTAEQSQALHHKCLRGQNSNSSVSHVRRDSREGLYVYGPTTPAAQHDTYMPGYTRSYTPQQQCMYSTPYPETYAPTYSYEQIFPQPQPEPYSYSYPESYANTYPNPEQPPYPYQYSESYANTYPVQTQYADPYAVYSNSPDPYASYYASLSAPNQPLHPSRHVVYEHTTYHVPKHKHSHRHANDAPKAQQVYDTVVANSLQDSHIHPETSQSEKARRTEVELSNDHALQQALEESLRDNPHIEFIQSSRHSDNFPHVSPSSSQHSGHSQHGR